MVAERAGISEASIFKRFGTKHALFRASMRPPTPPDWLLGLEERAGKEPIGELLRELALSFIGFFRLMMPRVMMLWSIQDNPTKPPQMVEPHPALVCIGAVGAFFEAEVSLGRLDLEDPQTSARIFMGACGHFVFLEIAGIGKALGQSDDAYVDVLVKMIVAGAGPEENDAETP